MNAKSCATLSFLLVFWLGLMGNVQAQGYTHSLFLCDLGLQSLSGSNDLGVNFVTYDQLGVGRSFGAINSIQKASQKVPAGTDLWLEANDHNVLNWNLIIMELILLGLLLRLEPEQLVNIVFH